MFAFKALLALSRVQVPNISCLAVTNNNTLSSNNKKVIKTVINILKMSVFYRQGHPGKNIYLSFWIIVAFINLVGQNFFFFF